MSESFAARDYPAIYRPNDSITLYRGDCLDILPTLTGVDALITDPPYGMNWETRTSRFSGGGANMKRGRARDWGPMAGDDTPFDPTPWLQFPRVVLFGSNHFAARLPLGTTLVWIKRHPQLFGTFLSDAELAWMKGGHGVFCYSKQFPPPARALEHGGDASNPVGVHPTQKPIGLMRWVMDRARVPAGAIVLDPFMGSGTTGIACIRTGRHFIGIEINPTHYATACRRIDNDLQQIALQFAHP